LFSPPVADAGDFPPQATATLASVASTKTVKIERVRRKNVKENRRAWRGAAGVFFMNGKTSFLE
jgi:hypothetical protein